MYLRRTLGYAVSMVLHWRSPGLQHFSIRLTGEQQQIAIERPIWYWIREGFDSSRFAGTRFVLSPAPRNVKVHASWGRALRDGLQVSLATAYGRYWGLTLASHDAVYDGQTTGLVVDPAVYRGRGNLATVGARLRYSPRESLQFFLYGSVRYKRSADLRFMQGARRQPSRSGSITARVRPMPRMSVFGRFTFAAPTMWQMYSDAALAAPDLYASTLPSIGRLDVTIQKRFWGDHVRLGASLRNMLDRTYPTHPAGPTSELAFQFYFYANT